jgi:uncharacterized membrane protein
MVGDGTHRTRREMQRAIRRLNALEYALLLGAAVLATAGGFLAALFLSSELGFPLRLSWVICSLLFFILPGVTVLGRETLRSRRSPSDPEHDESHEDVNRDGR